MALLESTTRTQESVPTKKFYSAGEIAAMLQISKTSAYRYIRELNAELEEKGYLTVTGKVSKRYFDERSYL